MGGEKRTCEEPFLILVFWAAGGDNRGENSPERAYPFFFWTYPFLYESQLLQSRFYCFHNNKWHFKVKNKTPKWSHLLFSLFQCVIVGLLTGLETQLPPKLWPGMSGLLTRASDLAKPGFRTETVAQLLASVKQHWPELCKKPKWNFLWASFQRNPVPACTTWFQRAA